MLASSRASGEWETGNLEHPSFALVSPLYIHRFVQGFRPPYRRCTSLTLAHSREYHRLPLTSALPFPCNTVSGITSGEWIRRCNNRSHVVSDVFSRRWIPNQVEVIAGNLIQEGRCSRINIQEIYRASVWSKVRRPVLGSLSREDRGNFIGQEPPLWARCTVGMETDVTSYHPASR